VTIVSRLAEFASVLHWQDVPDSVAAKVEDHVLDTWGVMCAGTMAQESAPAIKAMASWRGEPACTVVATDLSLPPPQTAFLNAFHGRIHTYDDTLESGPVHSGSVVTSAALAAAEICRSSGATFLASVLAGYEVVARIVSVFGPAHYAAGFHTTGTCNVFGAAAAACRARGLGAKAMAGALGIAGGMASGLRQYQVDGAICDSALNGAHAALAGVIAAELAATGLQGPAGVLDGKFGLGPITVPSADFSSAARGLGSDYLFANTAIKPFPTCRFTHGPLEVLARLQNEHGFTAQDIERVEIATFRQSIEVSDKSLVASRTDALLSHQTSAALLLTLGRIDLAALDQGAYAGAEVRRLAAKIHVLHDDELEAQYPEAWPHRIRVVLGDGTRLEAISRNPPGGAGHPLPRAVVESKFMANGEPILGRARARALLKQVRSLADIADVNLIVPFLRSGQPDDVVVRATVGEAGGGGPCV
jgi:2-methylcitrate dehydratase PrpD